MAGWPRGKLSAVTRVLLSPRHSEHTQAHIRGLSVASYHVNVRYGSKAGDKYVRLHLCDATCEVGGD